MIRPQSSPPPRQRASSARVWPARAAKLVAILRYPPYRRALRLGVAASTEHARTPLPLDYATVIDVGANRGQFALLAARRFPDAQLVCFEPLEGPRRTLERVLCGRPGVRIAPVALAASAQTSTMFVTRADDSSSLRPPTRLQLATFPGTDVVEKVAVTTERLDAVLDGGTLSRPALLKIDVQGGELDVLTGATGILDEIDTILVECSFVELYRDQPLAGEIVRFLEDRAFGVASVTNLHVDARGRPVQADHVFVREPRARSNGD